MTFNQAAGFLGVIMVGLPVMALAGPMDHDWHHNGLELLHNLNLGDAQKDKIKAIESSGEAQMREEADQSHELRNQLASALLAGATIEQLLPIQRQEALIRERMDSQRLELEVQVRDALTPAQLALASDQHAKLTALHQQERAVMGEQSHE